MRKLVKRCIYVVISLLILQFFLYYTNKYNVDYFLKQALEIKIRAFSEGEKILWENETQNEIDARRIGPGEQAIPFKLTDPEEIDQNEELFKKEGFYVLVSDKISYERALPDKRPKA